MQTEAEMFSEMAKTLDVGQLVHNEPNAVTAAEMYDRGWVDLSSIGIAGGGNFSRDAALGISLAMMCADVKARDLSKADCLMWERQKAKGGWRQVEVGHPVALLLQTEPNEDMSWIEFWYMIALHYSIASNAYALKQIDDEGTVTAVIPIMPARIRPVWSDQGRKFFEIYAGSDNQRQLLKADYLIVPADRVIHWRSRLYDGSVGLSNAILGGPLFTIMDALQRYQATLFNGNGRQGLVFEMDGTLGADATSNAAFNRLKDQLTERQQGLYSTGKPLVLEAGMKAKAVTINSKDGEVTTSFTQAVHRICGLMQTPPHKIFALDGVAYNNMASMDRAYASDVMLPMARNLETKFRNGLVPKNRWATYALEFDRAGIMASDPDSLEKLLKTAMASGLLTINEGRDMLPMRTNPIGEGGDDRTVPVNMALVKPDGTVRQAAQGQNPTLPNAGQDGSPDNNAGKEDDETGDKAIRLVVSNGG